MINAWKSVRPPGFGVFRPHTPYFQQTAQPPQQLVELVLAGLAAFWVFNDPTSRTTF